MPDKLERMADRLGTVPVNSIHEMRGDDEAMRKIQSLLRTLSAVLAKCEGAMENALEVTDQTYVSGLRRDEVTRGVMAMLRAALADLREVRR